MTKRAFLIAMILVAALAALAAVSCGDDDDDNDSGDDDAGDGDDDSGGDDDDATDWISAYVRSDDFDRLVIEVDYAPGQEPRDEVGPFIEERLADILDKPGGVEWTLDRELDPNGMPEEWDLDDLRVLARNTFDLEVPDGTVKMHALYVTGEFRSTDGDGRALGVAFNDSHFALFSEYMSDRCTSGPNAVLPGSLQDELCTAGEQHIALHEAGHLIGLVNNGLPMQTDHQDAEHGHHDVDDSCVMYWAYAGEGLFDLFRERLLGGNHDGLDFDENCLDDIAAYRDAK